MKLRTTVWLVLLAGGLVAFLYVIEGDRFRAESPEGLLPDFRADRVESVAVVRDRERIRAERAGGPWQLTDPLHYPANAAAIENLLQRLERLSGRLIVTGGDDLKEGQTAADFGLDPPRLELRLQSSARRYELVFGHRAADGEQVYFQMVGSRGIYLTPTAVLNEIPDSADAWRNRRFVRLQGVSFDALQVEAEDRSFTVEYEAEDRLWRMVEPLEDYAASSRLNWLVQGLREMEVREFVADEPGDLGAYGLESPRLRLTFSRDGEEVLRLDFGSAPEEDPDAVYALRPGKGNVVAVSSEIVDRFRRPYTRFRDRQLLRFDPEAVNRVEIESREPFTLVRRESRGWRVTEPHDFPADPALVESFLEGLGQLEIREFVKDVVTDFSTYELDSPVRSYTLKREPDGGADEDGDGADDEEPLARVDFGKSERDLIYTRRGQDNAVYAVSLGEAVELPQQAYEVRDRRLWDFDRADVVEITVKQHGRTRRLKPDEEGGWGVSPDGAEHAEGEDGDGRESRINRFSLRECLFELSRLEAVRWVGRGEARKEQLGFDDTDHQIILALKTDGTGEGAGRRRSIALGGRAASGNRYASLEIDGAPVVFEIPARLNELIQANLTIPGADSLPSE